MPRRELGSHMLTQTTFVAQVTFVGQQHIFGDIALVTGAMLRRSNDVQPVGSFATVHHCACDLAVQARPMLDAFTGIFMDALKRQASDVRLVRVASPLLASLGGCHTPRHEAACLWHAVHLSQ